MRCYYQVIPSGAATWLHAEDTPVVVYGYNQTATNNNDAVSMNLGSTAYTAIYDEVPIAGYKSFNYGSNGILFPIGTKIEHSDGSVTVFYSVYPDTRDPKLFQIGVITSDVSDYAVNTAGTAVKIYGLNCDNSGANGWIKMYSGSDATGDLVIHHNMAAGSQGESVTFPGVTFPDGCFIEFGADTSWATVSYTKV